MKKAIELIRVSTKGQAADDRGGIPAQKAANRQTANANGLEIVRTFQIEDVSGSKVLASPQMQELLKLIESKEIVGVVAKEFSRLMRPESPADYAILQQFIDTNTKLMLPDGPIDFTNKSGKLFGMFRAAMAGYERQEILERMTAGKEALRRAGRHTGGVSSMPFAMAYDKKTGVWSPKPEIEKVKKALKLVLTTTRTYADIGREVGIKRTSLRVILANPIYTGYRVYDQRRDSSTGGYVAGKNGKQGYRRKAKREGDDVIRVKVWEGIISVADHRRVLQILDNRAARERRVRSQNAPKYLFNGFLACAKCGSPLYSHSNTKQQYFICKLNGTRARKRGEGCLNPHLLAEKAEAKVQSVLAERLQDPKILKATAKAYLANLEHPVGVADLDVDGTNKLIDALQTKRSRIMDGFFEGVIDKAERDKRLESVDGELSRYRDMLGQPTAPAAPVFTADQLAAVLEVFASFKAMKRDQKRAILTATQTRVFMNGYTIDRIEIAPIPQDDDDSDTDDHSRTAAFRLPAPLCR